MQLVRLLVLSWLADTTPTSLHRSLYKHKVNYQKKFSNMILPYHLVDFLPDLAPHYR